MDFDRWILGIKSDYYKISNLRSDFSYFELYLTSMKELFHIQKNPDCLIGSIHMPSYITVNGKLVKPNYVNRGELCRKSFQMLQILINQAEKLKIDYVVIHPGYANLIEETLEEAQDRFCLNVKKNLVIPSEIKILIENEPLWWNLSHDNYPIAVFPTEVVKLFDGLSNSFGFNLDIEHYLISSLYRDIHNNTMKNFMQKDYEQNQSQFIIQIEKRFNENTSQKNMETFWKDFSANLIASKRFFSEFLTQIHVCGSDYCYYRSKSLDSLFPLIGEHLPINIEALVEGFHVKDQINHKRWLSCLKYYRNLRIVLEISNKKGYSLTDMLIKSKRYLEHEINKIIK
ncbi:MAG: hypothetical protein ACXADY_06360 [Candidatus Hodarchaeales archaeon]|jgi:hypothetical protein